MPLTFNIGVIPTALASEMFAGKPLLAANHERGQQQDNDTKLFLHTGWSDLGSDDFLKEETA
jgi:hypothetical protein